MQAVPNSDLPRTKRNACVVCRKRKMGCDGARPGCANCTKSGQQCSYEPMRRRSGPRRGYVKQLEARLADVEKQLTTDSRIEPNLSPPLLFPEYADIGNAMNDGLLGMNGLDTTYSLPSQGPEVLDSPWSQQKDNFSADFTKYVQMGSDPSRSNSDTYTPPFSATDSGSRSSPIDGELYLTGLAEPLPPQEMITELEEEYFANLHQVLPIIHKGRYLASSHLPFGRCPPCALRYIIWALAASAMPKYEGHKMIFYARAKSYLEKFELLDCGNKSVISVGFLQALVLACIFEYQNMLMARAWMSAGKASRLCVMMSYSRLDLDDDSVKKIAPDAKDFIELEERRRAFWGAYSCDRFASMGTGWAVSIDDADLATNLPCDEAAWNAGIEVTMPKLEDCHAIKSDSFSCFAAHILSVSLFNRVLQHLHRPRKENLADINDPFWARHNKLDEILYFVRQSLPRHLRLPDALASPALVFLNLSLQTNVMCLHQAAIQKARDLGFDHSLVRKSKHKCMEAAAQTTTIVRMYGSHKRGYMHPLNVFNVYVASRVFLRALDEDPDDRVAQGSLDFLIQYLEDERPFNELAAGFLSHLKEERQTSSGGKDSGAKTTVNSFPPCKVSLVATESFESAEYSPESKTAYNNGMTEETYVPRASAVNRFDVTIYGNDTTSETATPFAHSSSGSGGSPHSFSPNEEMAPLDFEKQMPMVYGQDDLYTFLNMDGQILPETDLDMMFKGSPHFST